MKCRLLSLARNVFSITDIVSVKGLFLFLFVKGFVRLEDLSRITEGV